MVALNFSAQFAIDVETGKKRQSIRQSNRGLREGSPIQLYTGQRTKKCRKLRDAICRDVTYVGLTARGVTLGDKSRFPSDIDEFARLDGFPNYSRMWSWFQGTYKTNSFSGYIIRWTPLP
jgi:hypothetical protein